MIIETILPLHLENIGGQLVNLANNIVSRVHSYNPQNGTAHIYIDPLFDEDVVKLLDVKIKVSSRSSKK